MILIRRIAKTCLMLTMKTFVLLVFKRQIINNTTKRTQIIRGLHLNFRRSVFAGHCVIRTVTYKITCPSIMISDATYRLLSHYLSKICLMLEKGSLITSKGNFIDSLIAFVIKLLLTMDVCTACCHLLAKMVYFFMISGITFGYFFIIFHA